MNWKNQERFAKLLRDHLGCLGRTFKGLNSEWEFRIIVLCSIDANRKMPRQPESTRTASQNKIDATLTCSQENAVKVLANSLCTDHRRYRCIGKLRGYSLMEPFQPRPRAWAGGSLTLILVWLFLICRNYCIRCYHPGKQLAIVNIAIGYRTTPIRTTCFLRTVKVPFMRMTRAMAGWLLRKTVTCAWIRFHQRFSEKFRTPLAWSMRPGKLSQIDEDQEKKTASSVWPIARVIAE